MQKTALRCLVWSENERALNFRVRVDVYVELLGILRLDRPKLKYLPHHASSEVQETPV